jgi:hypothetical protein
MKVANFRLTESVSGFCGVLGRWGIDTVLFANRSVGRWLDCSCPSVEVRYTDYAVGFLWFYVFITKEEGRIKERYRCRK